MVKINIPFGFEPQLNSDKQQNLRQEIADRALDINHYSHILKWSSYLDDINREKSRISFAFYVIQSKAAKLCKTTDEQNTATLVSYISSELSLLGDVRKYLDANYKNHELIRRIVNYASSLLFEFKEYEYNLFNDYMSQLKQSIE